jgi:hypothetical protein
LVIEIELMDRLLRVRALLTRRTRVVGYVEPLERLVQRRRDDIRAFCVPTAVHDPDPVECLGERDVAAVALPRRTLLRTVTTQIRIQRITPRRPGQCHFPRSVLPRHRDQRGFEHRELVVRTR